MLAAVVRGAPTAVELEPELDVVAPAESWAGQVLGHRFLLVVGVPVVSVALVVLWSILASSRNVETPPEPVAEVAVQPGETEKVEPAQSPKPAFARLDNRWLPDGTRLVVDLRVATLAGREEFDRVVRAVDPAWRPSLGRLLGAFGLTPKAVHRLTWASTGLSTWCDEAVAVIKLEEGQNVAALAAAGQAIELQLNGVACRRLSSSEWPHPFAVVGERTIVTGREDLLQQLAARGEPRLASKPIDRLLAGIAPDADLVFLVDLVAAREAGWRLPVDALDVWPAGRKAWRMTWELPLGLGFAMRRSDRLVSELALVCEGETAAVKVGEALAELVPAAKKGLAAKEASLSKRLEAGQINSVQAAAYESLLKQGQNALQAIHWELSDDVVWVRVDSTFNVPALALAAFNNRPAILADWLTAARVADESNQRGLITGLESYHKAEHRFPAGAEGGAMLSPETRLSWIASLLPYFGHLDWHRELQFGYSWNAPQNRAVAQRPLERLINPALGPVKTESGFPVTHYVGVSGVGPDAGNLKSDDPRAGVFGYGRTVRLDGIGDGASNTIATLGASQRLGAWAAGGNATVRPLTKRPYVNGPDGFGSGQPDGMLAGMADGSVRFISKDVDPGVLEQLATINGRDRATAVALDPKPAEPEKPQSPQTPKAAAVAQPAASVAASPGTAKPKPAKANDADPAEKKPEAKPEPVDVQARLADRVANIEFVDTPLGSVVALLSKLSTLPISYDLEGMAPLGVRLSDPVSLRVADGTVAEVLKQTLASRGLVYLVVQDQLLITCPQATRGTLRTVRYNVSDLVGPDLGDLPTLAAVTRRLVVPESWRPAGGQGTMNAAEGSLVVEQSAFVHYQVLAFCEKLRTARGVPLRSREDRQRFGLATRWDRVRARLTKPISVNFESTPLARIVAELSEMGRTPIAIDWLALRAQGVSPQAQGTLKVQKRPLAEALGELLGPLGLACRIVRPDTLEVTSRKALNAQLELEFYPAGDLAPKAITSAALIERIKSDTGGATWNDAGGAAVLHFDAPSRTLIVLQSQPVQASIESLLGDLRGTLLGSRPKP